MKIGLVIYGSLDTVSGGYLYDRKLVEYLRMQGDTVEIISLPWRNYAAHLTDIFWFRVWKPEARFWKIRQQAVRLQSFDILIQDELNHPSLIGANAGKHPYPIVSLVHHLRCSESRPKWQNDLYQIVEKKYLRSVDGFIFNSKTTERTVTRLAESSRPFIIAYPPTDRFGEAISKSEIIKRAENEEFRVLFLGNVIYRKGLHILLRAVSGQLSAVKVDVVGGLTAEPQYAKEMQRFIMVNGLSSMVRFHGALDNELLIEMYKQSHLIVVPSSYEGFGIVYLEGMGFGLPAIGTTAGAAGEVITHGEDGYLIEPDDANALAKHINELAIDRDLLVKLSLNALKRYKSQPRWDETAKSIREFLYVIARGDSPEAIPRAAIEIASGSASTSLRSAQREEH